MKIMFHSQFHLLTLSLFLSLSLGSFHSSDSEANLPIELPISDETLTQNTLPLALQYALSNNIGKENMRYHIQHNSLWPEVHNNGLTIAFKPAGPQLHLDKAILDLQLDSVGYGADQRFVKMARPTIEGNQISYHRGLLTEWYRNGPFGLQQGFTLVERPAYKFNDKQKNSIPQPLFPLNCPSILPCEKRHFVNKPNMPLLTLNLTLSHGWQATISADGQSAMLIGPNGSRLRYGELFVYDAANEQIPAYLTILEKNSHSILQIQVDDRTAGYPLTIDPFFQAAKLTASDGMMNDEFGMGVAISGDTVVIAAPENGGKGAVYVYEKPANGWITTDSFTAKLTASDGITDDEFGSGVAIENDTIVIGAGANDEKGDDAGAVYVYEKPASGWITTSNFTAKLTASDAGIEDRFGNNLAINNDTIFVGVSGDDDKGDGSGSVYVYQKPASGWSTSSLFTAKLIASDGAAGDGFGRAIAVSGNIIVIGAMGDDDKGGNAGAAYIYEKSAIGWVTTSSFAAKLTASDGGATQNFGNDVAIDGNVVVIGAQYDDDKGLFSGSAYVYQKPFFGWFTTDKFTAKLTASDGATTDTFGHTVNISGETIVITALFENDKGQNAGAVYTYKRPIGGWVTTEAFEVKLTASDGAANDNFGEAVAMNNHTIVIGSPFDDDEGDKSGSAYIFTEPAPEILVAGNHQEIVDGDSSPDVSDHTDFGSILINTTIENTFTISNTGNQPLSINLVSLSGTDANLFNVSKQPDPLIAANSSSTFTIQFTPTGVGTRLANLIIFNNDSDEAIYNFTLQGSGSNFVPEIRINGNEQEIVSGDMSPSPDDDTDFGQAVAGGNSIQQEFTISNLGLTNLTLGTVNLTGSNANDFKVIQQPQNPVAAKGSTTFSIEFAPTALGLRTAEISLSNNDSDENPYIFVIQGSGIEMQSVYLPFVIK